MTSNKVRYYKLGDTISEERHVRAAGSGRLGRWTPVAVINPDDREAVERLADIFCAYPSSGWVEQMQAALHEFANPTPPKPEEPMTWLAVVEDKDGFRWFTHRNDPTVNHETPWYCRDLEEYRDYADIAAVEVISEGVE